MFSHVTVITGRAAIPKIVSSLTFVKNVKIPLTVQKLAQM